MLATLKLAAHAIKYKTWLSDFVVHFNYEQQIYALYVYGKLVRSSGMKENLLE